MWLRIGSGPVPGTPSGGMPGRPMRPGPVGLWRDREFRTFWSAQTVSEFGDRITELALPLIAVTMLDATPAEVGFLTAAVWLPNVVSLFIGTWVDQQRDKNRRAEVRDRAEFRE